MEVSQLLGSRETEARQVETIEGCQGMEVEVSWGVETIVGRTKVAWSGGHEKVAWSGRHEKVALVDYLGNFFFPL